MVPESQRRHLGASEIAVSPLGVGTNRWTFGTNDAAVFETFTALMDAGVNFIDTAEIYSSGGSERLLGECLRQDSRPVVVASKFLPLPYRLSRRQFMRALEASLARLGLPAVDLYYVHFPYTLLRVETLMDMMVQAVEAGKVRAVGVSNFNATQMRRAAAHLSRYNLTLSANEVQYHLRHRQPEFNGVLEACRELDVALVAYRPLAGGELVTGPAGTSADKGNLARTLSTIAEQRGKSVSQVALRWLLQRDDRVIPIPGATTSRHAVENVGALSFVLDETEFAAIDQASSSRQHEPEKRLSDAN
jgi:aryl-alcohol dehydrogenase-like predicted oxidoreductase